MKRKKFLAKILCAILVIITCLVVYLGLFHKEHQMQEVKKNFIKSLD